MTSKNPEKLNVIILHIAYIPILFVMLLIFIGYNIVLWPLAYLKLFFHKLIMIMTYSKSFRVSRADKFAYFVLWVIFGFPILIANSAIDVYFFVKHMLMRDLYKPAHKTSDQLIDMDTLKQVERYFKERNEKMMPYKQIAIQIREKLDLMSCIMLVLKPKSLLNFFMKSNTIGD